MFAQDTPYSMFGLPALSPEMKKSLKAVCGVVCPTVFLVYLFAAVVLRTADKDLISNKAQQLPKWIAMGADEIAYTGTQRVVDRVKSMPMSMFLSACLEYALLTALVTFVSGLTKTAPAFVNFVHACIVASLSAQTLSTLLSILGSCGGLAFLGAVLALAALYATVKKRTSWTVFFMITGPMLSLAYYYMLINVSPLTESAFRRMFGGYLKMTKLSEYKKIDEEYRTALLDIARLVGVDEENVFVKPAMALNAFALGTAKSKYICIFESMFRVLSPKQLAAVLYHEAGHIKHQHSVRTVNIVLACNLAILMLAGAASAWVGRKHSLLHGMLVFFGVLAPLSFAIDLGSNYCLSVPHEREADRFAAAHGAGRELAEALLLMSAQSFYLLFDYPRALHYFTSHPSVMERYNCLSETAASV